jgi:hypothetical protein
MKVLPPPSSSSFDSCDPSDHSTSMQDDPDDQARSSNVRVVVRIRPMNQSERERRSKTSLYPMLSTEQLMQAPAPAAVEMQTVKEQDDDDDEYENDLSFIAASPVAPEQSQRSSNSSPTKTTPTRKGQERKNKKGFLSRLLTPQRKSNFGYSKTNTTVSLGSLALAKSHPIVMQVKEDSCKNLFSSQDSAAAAAVVPLVKKHGIQPPQPKHAQKMIPHPLCTTPPRKSLLSTTSGTAATAVTNITEVPRAKPVVTKRLMAESCKNRNHNHNRQFDFDAVFGPTATQQDVYESTVGDAVGRNIFRGFHTTIIAYGQTASGKTYTMGGPRDAKVLAGEDVTHSPVKKNNTGNMQQDDEHAVEHDDGIIPRAIHDLFHAKQCEQLASDATVTVELTYLEIYNDELRDLLVCEPLDNNHDNNGNGATMTSPNPNLTTANKVLILHDHGDQAGVAVTGLTKLRVESVDQAKALMEQATLRRTTGSTKLNERSSRSHAICTLLVTIEPKGSSETITAKLTLVDLAGSERIKETGVVGIQKQESININKDLFVLGKVVSALSAKSKKGRRKSHVPYRDSKLTRLLRDSIGGECLCCCELCMLYAASVGRSIDYVFTLCR